LQDDDVALARHALRGRHRCPETRCPPDSRRAQVASCLNL
jgi:hypothetical protein